MHQIKKLDRFSSAEVTQLVEGETPCAPLEAYLLATTTAGPAAPSYQEEGGLSWISKMAVCGGGC